MSRKAGTRVRCNVASLVARIEQVGQRAVKGVSDAMNDYGTLIHAAAIRNAPRDTESLETAIKIDKDYGGTNRRLRLRVWIDPNEPYVPRKLTHHDYGKTVGDYARLMEFGLSPFGTGRWSAREGTIAKGQQSGGRYFARAVQEYTKALFRRVEGIVKRAGRR